MQVAVLGAGMLGCCLSLELALRGVKVALYDREETCITQAGQRNEGKIHLGFVYGADPSFRTAEKMLTGALEFYPLVRRWLGQELDKVAVSSPFLYAVDKKSLLSVQEVEHHFMRLAAKIAEYGSANYPGGLDTPVRRLADSECKRLFSPEKIAAAFLTPERSIDVGQLALLLRKRILEEPGITFYPNTELKGVSIQGNQVEIEYVSSSETSKKRYDSVVNALWEGRLSLDKQLDLLDEAPWSFRLKHAIFLKSGWIKQIPSSTIIQGPFGDSVNFGGGYYYFSWYPVCLQGFVKNQIHPPKWRRNLPPSEANELAEKALFHLSEYIPDLTGVRLEECQELRVLGGLIYAGGGDGRHGS